MKVSTKFRKAKAATADEIAAIKRALPFGAISLIMDRTGYDWQICQRTLAGKIKVWDVRHSEIIREAKSIIKEVAL